ncbi:hypothetical protein HAX54_013107 [Datura stramonium]|uniref:Uncharacterized protein n=1 Tax=Datura stramonium TaxID=4076 RepID=A0ABS8RYP9_DATST|nr:hypothetical protein [Datura stramonium]
MDMLELHARVFTDIYLAMTQVHNQGSLVQVLQIYDCDGTIPGPENFQVIQEHFSGLGIGSTQPATDGTELSCTPATIDQQLLLFEAIHCLFNWLIRITQQVVIPIRQYQVEVEKVGVAKFHTLGEAQLWYYQLK